MDTKKLQNIILGTYRLSLKGRRYFVRKPSIDWLLDVEQFSDEFVDEGLMDEDEYQYFLITRNIWIEKDENKLYSLQKDIEELKVRMFQCSFNAKELAASRRVLKLANADWDKAWAKKHSFSFLSANAARQLNRMKLTFAGSIYVEDGKPLFRSPNQYMHFPCSILDYFIQQYKSQQADEKEIRYFARTEPWRSYWLSRQACKSVFDIPSIDLTEQQRFLINWSVTLDNINGHPKAPAESVINDDDRLDGWLIIQKRERDKALGHNELEDLIKNDKIRNSGEVFIQAHSKHDIEKINALNDADAQRRLKQRAEFLQKKGKVHEAQMPDSRLVIERMANEQMMNKAGK